jgi:hypothetical protein
LEIAFTINKANDIHADSAVESDALIIYSFAMMAFINRCVRAPLTYVADLRAISFK